MRIRTVEITNFRSIEKSGPVDLGPITVLIGPNNSGKSSFIQALYQMQVGSPPPAGFLRKGSQTWNVTLQADTSQNDPFGSNIRRHHVSFAVQYSAQVSVLANGSLSINQIPQQEPHAYVYPVLAKRKVATFQQTADKSAAGTIRSDWSFLPARLSKVGNQDFPGSFAYRDACKELLGFVVTQFPSDNGIQAGRYIDADTTIELEAMGEGVTSLAGMLVELATARNKLFLIEEPENDLHPTALKALLELIIQSSANNQFVVSTHSAIVLRLLGASQDAQIIKVELSEDPLPASSYTPVPATPESRLGVLRELGYEFSDFDLYEAWLILEEPSAERLIRQYFVKWFAPGLIGRLRTIAAEGTGDVEPKFRDLKRLCVFGHLEASYKNKIWVLCDGDPSGVDTVRKLRENFKSWREDRFSLLDKEALELYYPERFTEQAKTVFAMAKKDQREAKRILLEEVLAFIEDDEVLAKSEFEVSAKAFQRFLCEIEAEVSPNATP
jgi:AAA domain, putative AbiEii toxin, Type IV TA system/AAA ATPase domain